MASFLRLALIAGQAHTAHVSVEAQRLVGIRVVITAEDGLADLLQKFAVVWAADVLVDLEGLL